MEIKFENVSAGYKKIQNSVPPTAGQNSIVLDNISLEIKKGDFLGIIGPNGAGKSTIIRVMSGIIPPWREGQVIIKGKNIANYKRKELARIIGVVFQNTQAHLIGAYTSLQFKCYDIVLMGRFAYSGWFESKKDFEIARQTMELTETYNLRNRLIQEISGGELQRVKIAMALAQEPEILLLDEPTTHLDIHHEIEVFKILKKLNNNGLTIVSVSHNLNIVSAYAKTLALINKGRIVKLGSPEEVIEKDLIEEIYGANVIIDRNPLTHAPFVIPVTGS